MSVLYWLIIAAILIVIEIITLGLTTIWFAGGAIIAAVVASFCPSVIIQVVVFIIVSITLLVLTRPWAKKYMNSKIIKTNVEGLIGQNAMVTEEINNQKLVGQAIVNGQEWTARSASDEVILPKGSKVRIKEVAGVKLIVEKLEQ